MSTEYLLAGLVRFTTLTYRLSTGYSYLLPATGKLPDLSRNTEQLAAIMRPWDGPSLGRVGVHPPREGRSSPT